MSRGTVGGDLSIISEQDTSRERQRQDSSSGSLSLGIGAGIAGSGASLSDQKQRGDGDYASVNEQSGIFAGSGGFDIAVGGNTGLKGAVIASEADPEDNILITGTLTTEDIDNKSNYSATTTGWGVETDGTKGSISPSLPMNESGDDSSTTKSAISGGTIIITDEDGQLAKTGKTAEETVDGLNRDTDNAHQGPLAENPNLQDLLDKQKEIAAAAAGRAVPLG